jgi:outer membrane protein, multidrug efflux system
VAIARRIMPLVLRSCGIPDLCHADRRPDMPESFNEATNSENSAQLRIEEYFNDPTLTRLIDQALVGNWEVKILAQDVQIAGNLNLARREAYLPFVIFGGGQTQPLRA